MTHARWLRRGLVLAIILGAVTFVVAAPGGPGPNLAVQPAVIDVHLMLNQAGSAGTGNLTNTGDASASVMAIVPDSSCSSSGVSGFT